MAFTAARLGAADHLSGSLLRPRDHLAWLALILTLVVSAGLVAYVAIFVRHAQILIDYPYDIDQGEGYDVWAAWHLLQSQPIYTSNEAWPYYSTNYPPMYFVVLAPFLHWFGLTIGVGRALATTFTLLTGMVIFAAAREYSHHSLAAAFAALLFLGSTYVYHVGALARVNSLMTLLAMAAVYCAWRPTRSRLALAIGLALAAAFTKQTALDALAAVLAYLALLDWRRAMRAGLVALSLGVAAVAALEVTSQRAFLLNVVAGNANPWEWWQAFVYARNFLSIHLPVSMAAIGSIWLNRRRPLGIYPIYLVAAGLATLSAGKWGAGESYFLEALAALCVVAAPCMSFLLRHRAAWVRVIAACLLGWQLILYTHGPTLRRLAGFADRGFQAMALGWQPTDRDRDAADRLVSRYVLKWDGPVLAEDPGIVLASGKQVIGNATQLRNLYEAGRWKPDALVHDVEAKRFDFIVLNAQLYPLPVLAAIGAHYYLYDTVPVNGYNYQVFAPGAD